MQFFMYLYMGIVETIAAFVGPFQALRAGFGATSRGRTWSVFLSEKTFNFSIPTEK